ncbi:hypothetical protein VTN77DRAFT_4984 [Rasamsonia byssochlamydoides]|uniref:uncharacterized protein n=1 Tax=Rasamsonia byssochlamydoides TaxID=89139 RepID=UPI0037435730
MNEKDIVDAFETKPWREIHKLHPIKQHQTDSSLANLTNTAQYRHRHRHGHGYRNPLLVFRTGHWFLEILSFLVAVVCFVSIVVILAVHQNKKAPHWPAGITLNVAISWISNLLETWLMIPVAACISQLCWVWFNGKARPLQDICYYDAASRGPMGSLLLLYRLQTRFECSSSTFFFLLSSG